MDDTDDKKKKGERNYKIIVSIFAVLAAFGLGYLLYLRFFSTPAIAKPKLTNTQSEIKTMHPNSDRPISNNSTGKGSITGARNAESITKRSRPNLLRTMSNTGISYLPIENNSQILESSSKPQSSVGELTEMFQNWRNKPTSTGSKQLSTQNSNAIKSAKKTATEKLKNNGLKF